jgi:hypothetical protein
MDRIVPLAAVKRAVAVIAIDKLKRVYLLEAWRRDAKGVLFGE